MQDWDAIQVAIDSVKLILCRRILWAGHAKIECVVSSFGVHSRIFNLEADLSVRGDCCGINNFVIGPAVDEYPAISSLQLFDHTLWERYRRGSDRYTRDARGINWLYSTKCSKITFSDSDRVGWEKIASCSTGYGSPPIMASWNIAASSPPSMPRTAAP